MSFEKSPLEDQEYPKVIKPLFPAKETVNEEDWLIWSFMGETSLVPVCRYRTSWDWLMPVVQKIEALEHSRFGFNIDPHDIQVLDYKSKTEYSIVYSTRQEYSLMEAVYEAVIKFIQWYNSQSKQTL